VERIPDKNSRSSIARNREEDDCQPHDVHRSPDKNSRSSISRNREEDDKEYQPRNQHRSGDKNPRSSVARTREEDDVEYQQRDLCRDANKNQRSSLACTRDDDDDVEYQQRDPRRDADRIQRSSIDRMKDEAPSKPRQRKSSDDGHQDAEIQYVQPKGLPKQKQRRDDRDHMDQHQRPSLRNQRRDDNDVEDDDSDDNRRQPVPRNSHSPRQRGGDNEQACNARSPQKDEDVDFDNDSDGDTEVQSEDGSWRPITEDDLKGLRCRQQDNVVDRDDDRRPSVANRRLPDRDQSDEDDGRVPYKASHCSTGRQNYEDDDREQKSPQKNKTRHDERSERDRLGSKNQEMNVSLTPRGQQSPRSDRKVQSKKIVLDCQRDQDDIGSLKWGFNVDGAYLKRVPRDLSDKFGLDSNDLLVQINDKNVRRKSRKEIEKCWMDSQEEDDLLRLVLEGDK